MLNGLKQVEFSFEELDVRQDVLERMMGFTPGEVPEPFPELITDALAAAPGLFDIKAGYTRTGSFGLSALNKELLIGNKLFFPGKTVTSELIHSVEIALFVATAGAEVTHRCRELNESGETLTGYVLDTLGSLVAEKAAEKLADIIEMDVLVHGWHISVAFSPGYCDWNVAEQQLLFAFFPRNFCGITLSPSCLMNPVKSVSGIIGIGPSLSREFNKCKRCGDPNCIYGKVNRSA
jgi:hypothetical protein